MVYNIMFCRELWRQGSLQISNLIKQIDETTMHLLKLLKTYPEDRGSKNTHGLPF